MIIGIILSIIVAILWSLGEVNYSKLSKKCDRANVYMYTYLIRAIIYILIVVLFNRTLFGTFKIHIFLAVLPIILCDLFATYVVNIAVLNGKLTVVSPIMAAYPVLDIILGALLLHEEIGFFEAFLSSIIAIAIIFLALYQKKSKKAPHPVKGIIFAVSYMLLVGFSTYFEKSIYVGNLTVYDLYYYKGIVYTFASVIFALIVIITPVKMKPVNKQILKGCGYAPIGNILYSFALSFGAMTIAVITNILSRIILKERIRIRERICIGTIIVSTILLIVFSFIL